jgi:hypothetical protein
MLASIDLSKIEAITLDAYNGGRKKLWGLRTNAVMVNAPCVDPDDIGRRATMSIPGVWNVGSRRLVNGDWIIGAVPVVTQDVPCLGRHVIIMRALGTDSAVFGNVELITQVHSHDEIECSNTPNNSRLDFAVRGVQWELIDDHFIREIQGGRSNAKRGSALASFTCPKCGGKLTYFRFAEHCPKCKTVKRDNGVWAELF